MTIADDSLVTEVSGSIKWFDPARGFGFIISDEVGPDILLHTNVLRNFGQGSVADRARITALVQHTARGLQAVKIVSIEPPEGDGGPPISDLADTPPEKLAELPFLPARVKWFDKSKGFGFANIFGQSGDVFLHCEVLRHSGLSDLGVGEAVALRVVDGRRGLMAAQIAPWEKGSSAAEDEAEMEDKG
ncbi:cold-shock protein [Paracoccus sediminicola]|uniref:cold-shock protein n=1 Tax=Paracoccus sediminicola TaxID=3017783 RepID=UPI0022F0F996|nr:cold shock domain-containing protein [Paracoccus sediminicola]WBU57913.1 cold shock domain-containing protein [Paracoccus sediminicola]